MAGDDAKDNIFVTLNELKDVLNGKEIVKNGKVVNLVPHHKFILQSVLDDLKNDKKLKSFFSKNSSKKSKINSSKNIKV